MGQQIEVPGHGIVEFPDGMSDEQIVSAIKKNSMVKKPEVPKGKLEMLKDLFLGAKNSPIAGGPIGMVAREGMNQIDKGIERGAYATGGAVTDTLAGTVPPEVAAGAGLVSNIGVRAIPTMVGTLAGKASEAVTRNAPWVGSRALLQQAVKPSPKDLASGDAAKAIDTMLNGGFSATPAGVAQMRTLANKLSGEVDDLIKNSTGIVDRGIVRKEVLEKLSEFRKQVNPNSDVKTILKSWDEFKHSIGSKIPVQKAQEIKQGTYRILADKYAHLGTVGDEAGTQAQMAMARGLRKGIEEQVPGVVAPNKRMGELINAIELAERRAGVAGNRDLAGIAWLAENPLAGGGMLADRSPWLKSLLARYMHSGMPITGATAGTFYGTKQEADRARLVQELRGILESKENGALLSR